MSFIRLGTITGKRHLRIPGFRDWSGISRMLKRDDGASETILGEIRKLEAKLDLMKRSWHVSSFPIEFLPAPPSHPSLNQFQATQPQV